jgi:hypothetical protein
MPFTTDTAREAGRQGGRACVARHGREHMAEIGRLGFQGLARKLGYLGGSRRMALAKLLRRGKLRDLGPDPRPAEVWAHRVLEQFDPDNPDVPY